MCLWNLRFGIPRPEGITGALSKCMNALSYHLVSCHIIIHPYVSICVLIRISVRLAYLDLRV